MSPRRRRDRSAPLTPDQQALVSRNIGYALRIARRLTAHAPWLRPEAEAVAQEALCLEVTRYDPGRGVPFPCFVSRRIAGSIRDLMRRESPVGKGLRGADRPSVVPLDRVVGLDEDGFPYTYEDRVASPVPGPHEAVDSADAFAALLAHLEARPLCRSLVELVYGQDLTVEEAGRRIGVKSRTSYRVHADGLAKLRRILAARGVIAPMKPPIPKSTGTAEVGRGGG